MSGPRTRRARVRALAKINLDLRVLGERADGYHELRTIFQTVSLADSLEIAFTPARETAIELDDALAIADNLVVRAARLAMEAMGVTGRVAMRLSKRIPMGAGLGGGSSDAAAVLLALPVLAGAALDLPTLAALGRELGSDVPFFLMGGRAVGIGRGAEIFPLPDQPASRGLVLAPNVHVSTAEAYRALSPGLTTELQQNKIFSFQSQVWDVSHAVPARNDFEPVVFERHPGLAALKEWLLQMGASPALMTGSGSALFGLFGDARGVSRAIAALGEKSPGEIRIFRISLINRARYRALWWRCLKEHCQGKVWPPRSLIA
jgi:4-diphosphocytidyl-2-C-methyl-D-erythritol kinase